MAKLILETIQRGVHHYHKVDSFPVTIGRAFDNDVILQDVTISPHHVVIDQEGDDLYIQNLSTENGTKLRKKPMGDERVNIEAPCSFQMSGIKARLLPVDMQVESTHVKDCSGFFCIFSNPLWAIGLLLTTIAMFFYERYVTTPVPKEIFFYLNTVLPSIWIILGITVVISGISRISTHRWEIIPAISIAALIFLLPQLFEYIGHYAAYLLTEDSVGLWLKYAAKFIVIPALIAVFIVKTIHAKWLPAAGIAALVYSPFLAYQVLILVDELSLKSGFSEVPSYSQTLLPSDTRLNATISLDQFIKEADKEVTKEVEQMLSAAKKKEQES
ncbi:FHA domain-containing protein [uncultured Cocleimonas sp.]|uniref:FHA domain-containing protein n=1 Tax=uncultured Cocleimonas sp. TaxID=1051587 RepID=UPI00261F5C07|nr:FHA domain-containing protein [uncultured Cocleimonas sp.]